MSPAVIVPFRSLDGGKSRLASRLDQQARRRLCTAMLDRTLSLTSAYRNVLVVSDDEAVLELIARAHEKVGFLLARQPRDLNRAVNEARAHVPLDQGLLILPTDLVLLDQCALAAFIGNGTRLSIAPDGACGGTNLLLLPSAQAREFRFFYGIGSFGRHMAEARRLGVEPRVVRSSRSAFDLDIAEDLEMVSPEFFETGAAATRANASLRVAFQHQTSISERVVK